MHSVSLGEALERERLAVQAYHAAAEAGDPLGGVLEKELLHEVTALVNASSALRQQAMSQAMTQVRLAVAPKGPGLMDLLGARHCLSLCPRAAVCSFGGWPDEFSLDALLH